MSYLISAVPSMGVPDVWTRGCDQMIAKGLEYSEGRFTVASILDDLLNDKRQLWVVVNEESEEIVCAAITYVSKYPAREFLTVMVLGGTQLKGWIADLVDTFKRFADDVGADGMEFTGRKGWIRALRKLGWEPKMTVMSFDLRKPEKRVEKPTLSDEDFEKAFPQNETELGDDDLFAALDRAVATAAPPNGGP